MIFNLAWLCGLVVLIEPKAGIEMDAVLVRQG